MFVWLSDGVQVIDSSDVIIQVLDARDPEGTRCKHLEQYMKKNCAHKHLVLVLNKCDLIPTWYEVTVAISNISFWLYCTHTPRMSLKMACGICGAEKNSQQIPLNYCCYHGFDVLRCET